MGPQHANRLLFKVGYQRKFLLTLIKNHGLTQRKLSKKLEVNRNTLKNWIGEKRLLPENMFQKCLQIEPELSNYLKFVNVKLPSNWGQIKGGKIRSKMKTNLTRNLRIKGFRKANQRTVKRKVIGPFGEKMYNSAEKNIAEVLLNANMKYAYEPLIQIGNNYSFPDFLVSNIIVERCGYSDWSGYWTRLKKKLKLFEKNKIKFILVVPENRFNIAIRRIEKYVKNVIILKEKEIDLLPKLIKGLMTKGS